MAAQYSWRKKPESYNLQDLLIPSPESYATSVSQKQATGPAQIQRRGLHKGMNTSRCGGFFFLGEGSPLQTSYVTESESL